MRFRKQMSLLLLCATASLLGGCGIGTTVPAAGTTYTGAVLQGKLYGGQQPIAGARRSREHRGREHRPDRAGGPLHARRNP